MRKFFFFWILNFLFVFFFVYLLIIWGIIREVIRNRIRVILRVVFWECIMFDIRIFRVRSWSIVRRMRLLVSMRLEISFFVSEIL